MLEYKQGRPAHVPVRLFDEHGLPLIGAAPSLVTVRKADGSDMALTPAPESWREVGVGAFEASGTYELVLPTSALNVPGVLYYGVVSGAATHIGIVKVVAAEEVDTFRIVDQQLDLPISSRIVAFTGGGSTVRPLVTEARAPHSTHLVVTFSKFMKMTPDVDGALNLSNYSVEDLTLQSVTALSPQQVRIITSQQIPGALYRLELRNMVDLDGLPISSH